MSVPAAFPRLAATALAVLAVLGCEAEAREPPAAGDLASPERAAQSALAPASAPPQASSEPPGRGEGPCSNKTPGERSCDGNTLVVCKARGAFDAERACHDIEKCDASAGTCAPACPAGQIYIPPTGPKGFTMGRGYLSKNKGARYGKGHLPDSDLPHNVVLTKPFCMDEVEVTVERLTPCVASGECKAPRVGRNFVTYPKHPKHPVNSFSWPEARAFCAREGLSLPTEAQWEWAAGGGEDHLYPWGDEAASCERADYTPGVLPRPSADAGCHGGGPSEVGSHPLGDRVWPTGHLHDMAGNVWEWCLDNYHPYSGKDEVDPLHLDKEDAVHVVRGGGWNRSADGIRTSFRGGARHDYWVPGLGFRCVRNPKSG